MKYYDDFADGWSGGWWEVRCAGTGGKPYGLVSGGQTSGGTVSGSGGETEFTVDKTVAAKCKAGAGR
jgi:hypothetical protein